MITISICSFLVTSPRKLKLLSVPAFFSFCSLHFVSLRACAALERSVLCLKGDLNSFRHGALVLLRNTSSAVLFFPDLFEIDVKR